MVTSRIEIIPPVARARKDRRFNRDCHARPSAPADRAFNATHAHATGEARKAGVAVYRQGNHGQGNAGQRDTEPGYDRKGRINAAAYPANRRLDKLL